MKQMRNLLTGIFLMLGMLLTTLPVVAPVSYTHLTLPTKLEV